MMDDVVCYVLVRQTAKFVAIFLYHDDFLKCKKSANRV